MLCLNWCWDLSVESASQNSFLSRLVEQINVFHVSKLLFLPLGSLHQFRLPHKLVLFLVLNQPCLFLLSFPKISQVNPSKTTQRLIGINIYPVPFQFNRAHLLRLTGGLKNSLVNFSKINWKATSFAVCLHIAESSGWFSAWQEALFFNLHLTTHSALPTFPIMVIRSELFPPVPSSLPCLLFTVYQICFFLFLPFFTLTASPCLHLICRSFTLHLLIFFPSCHFLYFSSPSAVLLHPFLPSLLLRPSFFLHPSSLPWPLQNIALWQSLQCRAALKSHCSAEIGGEHKPSTPHYHLHFSQITHFISCHTSSLSRNPEPLPPLLSLWLHASFFSLSCSVFFCQRPIQLFIPKCLCTHA